MNTKSLSSLKREKWRIEQEGYLPDCWIGSYRPGGSAKGSKIYWQLRSRLPLDNGKHTRHLKPDEIDHYQRLVENGRRLKKITKLIARFEKKGLSSRAVLTSSASDEWYTPPGYIELVRSLMGGIDLDPASNRKAQEWIQAAKFYTAQENGLQQDWKGRLWLNPPYGNQTYLWTENAIRTYQNGHVEQAVLLVRPAPGSFWFQELSGLFPCCIPHKRIRFIDQSGRQQASPVHGNCFFYLGKNISHFQQIFSLIGVVTKPFEIEQSS